MTIRINGSRVQPPDDPRVSLLDLLRERLDLHGTKKGCAKTAASQFRGGIIMGLGLALMEETQFDERTGRVVNPSLAEYHVPGHMDVPEIDVIWTDIPDPHAPTGAHGVGEIGITGVGAAVADAVYDATDRRVRDLPLTLDKLI